MKIQLIFILCFIVAGCYSLVLNRQKIQSESNMDEVTSLSIYSDKNQEAITEESIFNLAYESSTAANVQTPDLIKNFNEQNSTTSETDSTLITKMVQDIMERDDSFEKVVEGMGITVEPILPSSFLEQFIEQRSKLHHGQKNSNTENESFAQISILADDDRNSTEKLLHNHDKREKLEDYENFTEKSDKITSDEVEVTEKPFLNDKSVTDVPPTKFQIPLFNLDKNNDVDVTGQVDNCKVNVSSYEKDSAKLNLHLDTTLIARNNSKRESPSTISLSNTSTPPKDDLMLDSMELDSLQELDPLEYENELQHSDNDSKKTAPDNIARPSFFVRIISAAVGLYNSIRTGASQILNTFSRFFS